MRNVLDLGKAGAGKAGEIWTPSRSSVSPELAAKLAAIEKFPRQDVEVETADGTKRTVGVRTVLLGVPELFGLVRSMADDEPMVYAKQGRRTVLGMLSPNYDEAGTRPLPSIKVIPLRRPYPLTARQRPDARMATMLAGAAHGEGRGVGAHTVQDYEHKLSSLGAISLGDASVALRHENHAVRRRSSVATGMTDGRLGNVFSADKAVSDFPGYGEPMVFSYGQTGPADAIYFPDSFLQSEEAFGGYYTDATRIAYGAGLEVLHARRGQTVLADIKRLHEQVMTMRSV